MVTLDDMANALNLKPEEDIKGFAVYGQVKSINPDGTYQVSLNGSTITTKCARLTGAHVDDVVLVTVLNNGYAVVTGCVGGDTDALEALEQSGATVQHFWYDDNGAHVTEDTQENYLDDPTNAGGNTLITAHGMVIRKGTIDLASFIDDLLTLGKTSSKNIRLEPDGLGLYYGNIMRGLLGYENNSADITLMITPRSGTYAALKEAYDSANAESSLTLETRDVSGGSSALMKIIEYSNMISFRGYIDDVRQGGVDIDRNGDISAEGKIRGLTENLTASTTVTATTGALDGLDCRRFGQVIQLTIRVHKTTATAQGANIFEGTLTPSGRRPAISSMGCGYFGTRNITGAITSAGAIVIRNCGESLPANNTVSVSFTYLVN